MEDYDVVVVGSGSGMIIADNALEQGFKVAVVDQGPLGGTCLNVGCIPSKMLLYPAEVITQIQEARRVGIEAGVKKVDFQSIMRRMRGVIEDSHKHMRTAIKQSPNLDFYEARGKFVDDYSLEVGDKKIRGEKIFLVSGARPEVPPIKGIERVNYLDNEKVLELKEVPESIIIAGGGYIAAEYSHFFASLGSQVTVVQRNSRILPQEEPEVSALLEETMKRRMGVHTSMEVREVEEDKEGIRVKAEGEDRKKDFSAKKLLLAVGRRSNADLLGLENTGVERDERDYIIVNDYLETTKEKIWALGDATGRKMYKHVANEEAHLAWHNAIHDHKARMDYLSAPHAVYSHPQVASVGLTQEEAQKDHHILVGKAGYMDVAKGEAMVEEEGFAKAIVERGEGRILGFHIVGPHAPILIQEVTNAMASGGNLSPIARGMHIHPALPELIPATLNNLEEP